MAFIEDSTPQKITAKILSVGLFCGAGSYKRQEKKKRKRRKRERRETKRKSHR